MKRNLLVATFVGAFCCASMWGVARGQQGKPSGSGGGASGGGGASIGDTRIALVDLGLVLKNYQWLEDQRKDMKADETERKDQITNGKKDIDALIVQAQQKNPDSPDYKTLAQKISSKKTDLELLVQRSDREFTQKAASTMHQAYREAEDAVKAYAQRNGIAMVLTFSRDNATNPNDRGEVLRELNQVVFYSQPGMDITDDIVNTLNKTKITKGTNKPAGPGTGTNKGIAQPSQKTVNELDNPKGKAGGVKKQ